jgi:hypothetical protein
MGFEVRVKMSFLAPVLFMELGARIYRLKRYACAIARVSLVHCAFPLNGFFAFRQKFAFPLL